jgi:hypothetical protein
VLGQANGTADAHELLTCLDRLSASTGVRRQLTNPIGCIAVTEPVFFPGPLRHSVTIAQVDLCSSPRLGQSSFRLEVLDAYDRQRAVTTEHSLPVIDAAHIHPWADGGTHEIRNGIPLRRDLHRLFDLGYVTIRPDMRFAVSRRLRDEFANGRVYYDLYGRQIQVPRSLAERPSTELLAWHEATVFQR